MVSVLDDKLWKDLKTDLCDCRFTTNVAVKEYLTKNISVLPARGDISLHLSSMDKNNLGMGLHPNDKLKGRNDKRNEYSKTKGTKSWRDGISDAIPFLRSLSSNNISEMKGASSTDIYNKSLNYLDFQPNHINYDDPRKQSGRNFFHKPRPRGSKSMKRLSGLTGISEDSGSDNAEQKLQEDEIENTVSLLRMAIAVQVDKKSPPVSTTSSAAAPSEREASLVSYSKHTNPTIPRKNRTSESSKRRNSLTRKPSTKTTRTDRMNIATTNQEVKERDSVDDDFDYEPGFFPLPSTFGDIPRSVTICDENDDDISIITTMSDMPRQLSASSDVHLKMAKRMGRLQ